MEKQVFLICKESLISDTTGAANIIDQLTESGVLSEPNSKGQREIYKIFGN